MSSDLVTNVLNQIYTLSQTIGFKIVGGKNRSTRQQILKANLLIRVSLKEPFYKTENIRNVKWQTTIRVLNVICITVNSQWVVNLVSLANSVLRI
jgi:hypothetical protein